jgi:hypothetical protein
MKTIVIINGKEEEREVDYITKDSDSLMPNEIVPVLHDGENIIWIFNEDGKRALIVKN